MKLEGRRSKRCSEETDAMTFRWASRIRLLVLLCVCVCNLIEYSYYGYFVFIFIKYFLFCFCFYFYLGVYFSLKLNYYLLLLFYD